MNNDENIHSSPPAGESEELLRELMPKLGMEAAEPGQKYKNRARMRYFLPRLLAVCLAVAVFAAAAIYLFTPAAFRTLTVDETDPDAPAVECTLSRVLILEGVVAKLDGRPVAAELLGPGHYRITPRTNGELVITARTVTGRETVQTVTISSIDSEPPHVERDEAAGGFITIWFTDGDGSGVDWSSVSVTDAATGQPLEGVETDSAEGFVRFPFPSVSARIRVGDHSGNTTAVLLSLRDQSGGDDREPVTIP